MKGSESCFSSCCDQVVDMNLIRHAKWTLSLLLAASMLISSVSGPVLASDCCACKQPGQRCCGCCCGKNQDDAQTCCHRKRATRSGCQRHESNATSCCAVKRQDNENDNAVAAQTQVSKHCLCHCQRQPMPAPGPCQSNEAPQVQWEKLVVQLFLGWFPVAPVDAEVRTPCCNLESLVQSHCTAQAVLGVWLT